MRQSLLLVDEPVATGDLQEILVDIGYRVAGRAASVGDAFGHLQRATIDAAIVDVRVGGRSSYPLAAELANRNVPFLLTSVDRGEVLPPRLRGRPLIHKPLETTKLVAAVTRLTGVFGPGSSPASPAARWPWWRSPPFSRADLDDAESRLADGARRIARIETLLARHRTPLGDGVLAELRRSLRLMTEFRDLIRREVTSGSPDPSDATSGRDARVARELLRLAPMSQRLSAHEPPPAGTTRWVRSRKLAVVAAILHGRLTVEEACARYDLTAEELVAWREMADAQRRPG